jgi:SPX domain protein involved in polyphosphate accumulation
MSHNTIGILTHEKIVGALQAEIEQLHKYAGRAAELGQRVERLEKALKDAATSLHTISEQAGLTDELDDQIQIRGYAYSRWTDAMKVLEKEGTK